MKIKNYQKGSMMIVVGIILVMAICFGLYFYIKKNDTIKNVNLIQTATSTKENTDNSEMVQFRGTYLIFNHPKNWEVEEDEKYGQITITRYDKDRRPDISYSIFRSKFDRDSKENYKKFLLEYSDFMDNVISENEIKVLGKLKGVGTEALVGLEDNNKKITVVMNVIHLKMQKPLNEYFDAVTISGYHVSTLDGVQYFTQKDKDEVSAFFKNIDIIEPLEQNKFGTITENIRLGFSMFVPYKIHNQKTNQVQKVEVIDDGKSDFILLGPNSYGSSLKVYVSNAQSTSELEKFIHDKIPETKDCVVSTFKDTANAGTQDVILKGPDSYDGDNCTIGNPLYIKYSPSQHRVAVWLHKGQDTLFFEGKNEYDDKMYDSFLFVKYK